MRHDFEHDVTWCGCGLAAPGRVEQHPCRVACCRVPAHLAAALGVSRDDVVAVAQQRDGYEPEAVRCDPDPGRCRTCAGEAAGWLTVSAVEDIISSIEQRRQA